jgi:hypothetical protein
MHRSRHALAVIATIALSVSSVSAAQKGHSGGPKPRSTTSLPAPKTTGPKVQPAKAQSQKMQAPKGNGAATHGPKTHTASPKGAAGHGTKTHGAKATSAATDRSSLGTSPTSTTTLSPVQQKLQRNTNLASKLSSRLPAGTDLMTAAADFRNLGQFVAAVNASSNLDIPFADLKSRMVDDGMSLGQAIQDVRPSADGTLEARRAESTASVLIEESERTSSKTRSPKTKPSKTKPTAKAISGEVVE